MRTIFDRIHERLRATGLSQRRASLTAGMSADALNKLLSRTDQSPTLETVRKLAVGLQTTPEWLAFGIGDAESSDPDTPVPGPDKPAAVSSLPALAQPGTSSRHDTAYIQVGAETLRRYVSGVLQNESIPVAQADAYADAVLELIRGRATAHVVLRLEGTPRSAVEFLGPRPADQS